MATIPLFPLSTVLVPGAALPLRIFEPRYVAMLRDLITDPQQVQPFGVVAIRAGVEVGTERIPQTYPVGCLAELEQVAPIGEEQFALVGRGGRRFEVRSIDADAKPYLTADVAWLGEPVGTDEEDRLDEVVATIRSSLPAYWESLGATGPEVDDLSDDPLTLSYELDAVLVVERGDRQRLLAAPDAFRRLQLAAGLIRRESALLTQVRSVPYRRTVGESGLN